MLDTSASNLSQSMNLVLNIRHKETREITLLQPIKPGKIVSKLSHSRLGNQYNCTTVLTTDHILWLAFLVVFRALVVRHGWWSK